MPLKFDVTAKKACPKCRSLIPVKVAKGGSATPPARSFSRDLTNGRGCSLWQSPTPLLVRKEIYMGTGDEIYGSDDSFPASFLQPPGEKILASENPDTSRNASERLMNPSNRANPIYNEHSLDLDNDKPHCRRFNNTTTHLWSFPFFFSFCSSLSESSL